MEEYQKKMGTKEWASMEGVARKLFHLKMNGRLIDNFENYQSESLQNH